MPLLIGGSFDDFGVAANGSYKWVQKMLYIVAFNKLIRESQCLRYPFDYV